MDFLFKMVAISLAISVLFYIIAKILRFAFSKTISFILFLALFLGGAYYFQPQILNNTFLTNVSNKQTKSVDDSSNKNNEIRNKLIDLTNNSNPGENQNYYWDNGNANLVNDDDVKNGSLLLSHDEKGRSGLAKGKLTYQMFKDSMGSRQGTPLNPPNWPLKNPKVAIPSTLTGRTYHGFFYNRSHSIADSLAGKESYTSNDNFTTGTRTQNVGADQNGGMRAAEELAENYWKTHPNSNNIISYQVTPIYNNDETIPRGSIVDEKSSDGQLNKEIVVINDAQGYTLNYVDGSINKK